MIVLTKSANKKSISFTKTTLYHLNAFRSMSLTKAVFSKIVAVKTKRQI